MPPQNPAQESSPQSPIAGLEIETSRLLLRAPRHDDSVQMVQLANDAAVALMTARMPHPYRLEDALAFLDYREQAWHAGTEFAFAIESKAERAFLGVIGLRIIAPDAAEVGYWLGQRYWGRGYATEAARAVIDHGFSALPLVRITGECRVTNDQSRRVMEKCGMRYIDSGLYAAPARGGALPVDRFSLSRADWQSLKAWCSPQIRQVTAAVA